jgi:hypothetical protein
MSTPAMVAMGTLRSGLSTTAAATDALSSPVKAQNTSASDCGNALVSGSPLTFQDSRNCAASKAYQPSVTTSSNGIRPAISNTPSNWPTKRGLTRFTTVTSHNRITVSRAPRTGPALMPKKDAR